MKDDVLQRIKEVYAIKATSETQFAKQIGANQKTINQQFKGERALSLDTILLISSAFEDVSLEWLLRGEGNMLKQNNESEQEKSQEAEMTFYVDKNGFLKLKK